MRSPRPQRGFGHAGTLYGPAERDGDITGFLRVGQGNGHEPDCARARSAPGYFSDAINCSHAWAGNASVTPSRSVVSRTMIAPALLAVSTQEPPLASE